MLPVELWKHIALLYTEDGQLSPKVYMVLSLVSHKFVMSTAVLQEYYLRKHMKYYFDGHNIEYRLPNGNIHSPGYGKLPAAVGSNGNNSWHVHGKLHRDGDLPAVVCANGDQYWYVDGKQHRDGDLPATIYANGDQYWYVDGKLHRDGDLPAIICANGDQYWCVDGKRHRDNDMPAVILANGYQKWYLHGNDITNLYQPQSTCLDKSGD